MAKFLLKTALFGFFAFFALLVAGLGHHWWQQAAAPKQPIDFPHTVHAGQLGLACDFCHTSVGQSPRAGVPPLEKCLSCHRAIAVDRPEIKKLLGHWQDKKPVIWSKVHVLPDHVYFTHVRHIKAGLDCAACHGGVKEMKRVRQVRSLEMGWCVNCHKTLGAPRDCATCHK